MDIKENKEHRSSERVNKYGRRDSRETHSRRDKYHDDYRKRQSPERRHHRDKDSKEQRDDRRRGDSKREDQRRRDHSRRDDRHKEDSRRRDDRHKEERSRGERREDSRRRDDRHREERVSREHRRSRDRNSRKHSKEERTSKHRHESRRRHDSHRRDSHRRQESRRRESKDYDRRDHSRRDDRHKEDSRRRDDRHKEERSRGERREDSRRREDRHREERVSREHRRSRDRNSRKHSKEERTSKHRHESRRRHDSHRRDSHRRQESRRRESKDYDRRDEKRRESRDRRSSKREDGPLSRSEERRMKAEVGVLYNGANDIGQDELRKKYDEIKQLSIDEIPVSTSDMTKRGKELFIQNYPPYIKPESLMELMNAAMTAIEATTKEGNAITNCWVYSDKKYAILEFRSEEEADNAFKLDEIKLVDRKIKLGKPRYPSELPYISSGKEPFSMLTSFVDDLYNPHINESIAKGEMRGSEANYFATSMNSAATSNSSKLLVSNLPPYYDKNSVYKLLVTFGKISILEMIKDSVTKQNTGQCYVEYEDEKNTKVALKYIMGMKLGNNVLSIRRSTGSLPTYGYNEHGILVDKNEEKERILNTPSKVLAIMNIVSREEVEDERQYKEIYDTQLEEAKIYGKVISIKIPRPGRRAREEGIGNIYIEYATLDGAMFAKNNLGGKSRDGKFLEVFYHPEENYHKNKFD